MSSNMQILKVCEFCSEDFIAKKTTSACCSDKCAKQYYKKRKRDEKIKLANEKTEASKIIIAARIEKEYTIINTKRFLNLQEAAALINITPLTLRRWLLTGRIQSSKVGKKWIFDREKLQKGIMQS